MTTGIRRLRQQLGKDVQQGEQIRDTQQALDSFPVTFNRTVEMNYAEPMMLNIGKVPASGLEAIRVVDMAAQEQPVIGAGGVAHFNWKPQLGGAQITSINGMTAAAHGGKRYRFVFRVTLSAEGGG